MLEELTNALTLRLRSRNLLYRLLGFMAMSRTLAISAVLLKPKLRRYSAPAGIGRFSISKMAALGRACC